MAVHSPVDGTTAIPWRHSSRRRRRPSLLEQLRGCQRAWCPAAPWDRQEAHTVLCGTPTGSFLVVGDCTTSLPSLLLCVSAGEDNDSVLDYHIKTKGTGFQLSESRLSFSDLAQLVLFYSLTRDVLTMCLSIPHWIHSLTTNNKDCLCPLEPRMWLSSTPDQEADEMTHMVPSTVMCSIQLTSTNGALCIINPLYIHEHGDDWLTHRERTTQCTTQSSRNRRERRLSTTRPWPGAGLRSVSLDQESSAAREESSGLTRAKSADSSRCLLTPTTPASPAGIILRRTSQNSACSQQHRASTGSLSSSTPSTPESNTTDLQHHGSSLPQPPHRVSWIEEGVWLPPPTPCSTLLPPSVELDSLSVSSTEEDLDSPMPSPTIHLPSAHRLADKVMNRLSAVGQVLGGLVCQKKRLTNRVKELSERKGGAFAEAVKGFVEMTQNRGADPTGVTGSEFLQEVRSSLTSLRETLLDYPDIQALLDCITDLTDREIESLVELSIHKVALKPISTHLYFCIHTFRTNDGSLERLRNKLPVLEKNGVEELGGSEGVGVPDSVSLERIQQRWAMMHEAYSPNTKVQILLKVCKSIYHGMSANASSGAVFGADDFLPCLTWVLLRSDVVTLQVDTDYMMELLDPTQLQGEGGYYLTTLYASLYYISSFRPRLAARQLSVEAQDSLNQWHRRRTLHSNHRRSKHRWTIQSQSFREMELQASCTEKSGKQNDLVNTDESAQQRETSAETLPQLKEEPGREHEDGGQSLMSSTASNYH